MTLDLKRWMVDGDQVALEKVAESLYADLHEVARRLFARERPDHTLQPTALLAEAWMALYAKKSGEFKSERHFRAWMAKVMALRLVDYAREHVAEKRGKGVRDRTLVDELSGDNPVISREGLIDLSAALEEMAGENGPARGARMRDQVEMYFYGGLTWREIADFLGVTKRTVMRDWGIARAWLKWHLSRPPEPPS